MQGSTHLHHGGLPSLPQRQEALPLRLRKKDSGQSHVLSTGDSTRGPALLGGSALERRECRLQGWLITEGSRTDLAAGRTCSPALPSDEEGDPRELPLAGEQPLRRVGGFMTPARQAA